MPARRAELPRREGRTRAALLAGARAGFSIAKAAARLPRGARGFNAVGASTGRGVRHRCAGVTWRGAPELAVLSGWCSEVGAALIVLTYKERSMHLMYLQWFV